MTKPTFSDLDKLLRRIGSPADAAECHGSLCGTLSSPESDVDAWLERTLEGVAAETRRTARPTLESIASFEQKRLRGGDMSFTPMLPDDELPLPERTGALGEWCEGFLFGVGTARIDEFDRLPDTVQEALRDLVEIARVGIPAGEDDSDEAAYGELIEYLRVAVQLIHDEFHPVAAATEVPAPRSIH